MKYVLIFIYLAISILLFVLNWDLFTTFLLVDLGFGEFKTLPFLTLQIFGAVILVVFALVDGYKDLKRELKISELQNKISTMLKDAEIASLKKGVVTTIPEKSMIKEVPTSSEKEN